METFSADWLALREPADHAARASTMTERAVEALEVQREGAGVVRVLDLGSGSGSNLRYLASRLPFPQRWLLLDHDAALLAEAERRAPVAAGGHPVEVETHRVDLRNIPDEFLKADDATLVTGSALLDLVSETWLEALSSRCRAMGAVVLFVLSYDGRIVCDPSDALDAEVQDLVNGHQHTDKGFGPATGPDATGILARQLAANGYTVHVSTSDWNLTSESGALQQQLVDGWAGAAAQLAGDRTEAIAAWRARRFGSIAAGHSRIRVGHQDLLAYPTPPAPVARREGRPA